MPTQTQVTRLPQKTERPNHDGFVWRKRSSVDPNGEPPKVAPAESFWMLVKVVCFLVMAFYNVMFFAKHTQGLLTIVTCVGAVFLEISGFFCVLWWNRTSEKHRKALMTFGIIFMVISLVHATLGYYDMQPPGSGGWIGTVAFPLIFLVLMIASIVIPMKHWEREYVQKQIENEIALEKRICDMQTQLLELEAENEFQDSKAILLTTQIQQRARHMEIIKAMVQRRQQEKDYVWSIADPEIRADAARLIDDQAQAKLEFKQLSIGPVAARGPVIPISPAPRQQPIPKWRGGVLLNSDEFTDEELEGMGITISANGQRPN